jgi:hypothetical protein
MKEEGPGPRYKVLAAFAVVVIIGVIFYFIGLAASIVWILIFIFATVFLVLSLLLWMEINDIKEEETHCPQCSTLIPDESIFCLQCGGAIGQSARNSVHPMIDFLKAKGLEQSAKNLSAKLFQHISKANNQLKGQYRDTLNKIHIIDLNLLGATLSLFVVMQMPLWGDPALAYLNRYPTIANLHFISIKLLQLVLVFAIIVSTMMVVGYFIDIVITGWVWILLAILLSIPPLTQFNIFSTLDNTGNYAVLAVAGVYLMFGLRKILYQHEFFLNREHD